MKSTTCDMAIRLVILLLFLSFGCTGTDLRFPAPGSLKTDSSKNLNIILITLDTVRADRLTVYGFPMMSSPVMSRLAGHSTLFPRAIAQSTWTLTSHASLLTGLDPREHGAINWTTPIAAGIPILPQFLKQNGYATAAFVSHYFVLPQFGFGAGFDHFDSSNFVKDMRYVSSRNLVRLAENWIDSQSGKFFVWLHDFDPHNHFVHHPGIDFSYDPAVFNSVPLQYDKWNTYPCEFGDFFQQNRTKYLSLYTGEIYLCDDAIGDLIHFLQDRGRIADTMIIITADHGEAFMDHDLVGHGESVYPELTDVPLIVYVPGRSPGIDPRITELKSIPGTILHLIGAKSPEYLGTGIFAPGSRSAFSDITDLKKRRSTCLVTPRWRLVHHCDTGRFELFDETADPGDRVDVSARHPHVTETLKSTLLGTAMEGSASAVPEQPVSADSETVEHLRSLGYIR